MRGIYGVEETRLVVPVFWGSLVGAGRRVFLTVC
jgi:hypothetical protein